MCSIKYMHNTKLNQNGYKTPMKTERKKIYTHFPPKFTNSEIQVQTHNTLVLERIIPLSLFVSRLSKFDIALSLLN